MQAIKKYVIINYYIIAGDNLENKNNTNISDFIKKFFDITFWKFIIVGVVNTLFGTGVMFLFYNVFHFSYWVSSASNYIFGSILSYFLNKFFTFQSKKNTGKTLVKFVINISLCYLVAYGVAKPIVKWMLGGASVTVQDNLAMLVGMGLFVILNYCGQRFFVFTDKQNETEKSEETKPETEE